jgi:hypothetical protein
VICVRAQWSVDLDIESEDENDMGGDKERSTPSTSVTASGRPMTARQAVLASVVDSTHVSLCKSLPYTFSVPFIFRGMLNFLGHGSRNITQEKAAQRCRDCSSARGNRPETEEHVREEIGRRKSMFLYSLDEHLA